MAEVSIRDCGGVSRRQRTAILKLERESQSATVAG